MVGGGITLIFSNKRQETSDRKQETSDLKQEACDMSHDACPLFAFVVSTKVDKRAFVRNRMRRVMSESIRHLYDQIVPVSAILIGSKALVGLSQAEVETRVREVLGRAGLLVA